MKVCIFLSYLFGFLAVKTRLYVPHLLATFSLKKKAGAGMALASHHCSLCLIPGPYVMLA